MSLVFPSSVARLAEMSMQAATLSPAPVYEQRGLGLRLALGPGGHWLKVQSTPWGMLGGRLREDDIIVRANGTEMITPLHFKKFLEGLKKDSFTLTVKRQGVSQPFRINVKGYKPRGFSGIKAREVSIPDVYGKYGEKYSRSGANINLIKRNNPSARKVLQEGDVVLAIKHLNQNEYERIHTGGDLNFFFERTRPKEILSIVVLRNRDVRYFTFSAAPFDDVSERGTAEW